MVVDCESRTLRTSCELFFDSCRLFPLFFVVVIFGSSVMLWCQRVCVILCYFPDPHIHHTVCTESTDRRFYWAQRCYSNHTTVTVSMESCIILPIRRSRTWLLTVSSFAFSPSSNDSAGLRFEMQGRAPRWHQNSLPKMMDDQMDLCDN